MASGSWGWIAFLFAIHLCAGLALMVGWHTRLATAVCWVLTVSLHNRNPLVLHSGDVIIRRCSSGHFLPLGARWSIDARQPLLRPGRPPRSSAGPRASSCSSPHLRVHVGPQDRGPWLAGRRSLHAQIDHFTKQPQGAHAPAPRRAAVLTTRRSSSRSPPRRSSSCRSSRGRSAPRSCSASGRSTSDSSRSWSSVSFPGPASPRGRRCSRAGSGTDSAFARRTACRSDPPRGRTPSPASVS